MPANIRPVFETIRKANPGLFEGSFTGVFALALFVETVRATEPHIDLIERYDTNRVTIHFNTDANRVYTLQYSSATNSGTWSNVYTISAEPFPNHYILVAPATNAFGFYRLAVTP